jgi:hypothetical protein
MNNPLFLHRDEVQILVNLFTDETIKITYPFYDFTIGTARTIDDSVELKLTCANNDFRLCQTTYNQHYKEMPGYDDLITTLFSSGILTYTNQYELDSLMAQVHRWKIPRKAWFTVDTNLFYHGFFTNYQHLRTDEIILIDTIGKEIDNAKEKYLPEHIGEEIQTCIPRQQELYTELLNRRTKKSRQARFIALPDHQQLIQHGVQDLPSIREPLADNDENDQIIVDTAVALQKERFPDLYLLTADQGVAERCKQQSLNHLLLKVPQFISTLQATAQQFNTLIYNLARIFGIIKMNNTILYGEFQQHEQRDPTGIMALSQHDKTQTELIKHLIICRNIQKLGIKKGE